MKQTTTPGVVQIDSSDSERELPASYVTRNNKRTCTERVGTDAVGMVWVGGADDRPRR